jgi:hypothetical protein
MNYIRSVACNPDGSIIALGVSQNNTDSYYRWLINKYDFNGNNCCTQNASLNVNYSAGTLNNSNGLNTVNASLVNNLGFIPASFSPVFYSDCQSVVGFSEAYLPELKSKYLVYPNPSTAGETLLIKGEKIKEIRVYSVLGEFIPSNLNKKDEAITELKFSAEPGLYFVKISGENISETYKVIRR